MIRTGKILHRITFIISVVSMVGFLGITLLTTSDVIIRYITGDSILGVYEIVERTMICAVFAGFAYTQSEHGHIKITMAVDRFPEKVQFVIYCIHSVLSAGICALCVYASYKQSMVAFDSHYTTAVLLIPTWPFYWVEIICMAALAVVFLYEAVEDVVALFNPKVAVAARAKLKGESGI